MLTDTPEAAAKERRAEVEEAIREMGIVAGKSLKIVHFSDSGLVTFIAAAEGFPIPIEIDPSAPVAERALRFFGVLVRPLASG